jgi:UDP-N-acetyl-D-glucosamine dehydrogenase
VDYCDPFFPVARAGRKHDIGLSSVPCTAEALREYDALVVATAHNEFKNASLYKGVSLVIDTRYVVHAQPDGPSRVVRA